MNPTLLPSLDTLTSPPFMPPGARWVSAPARAVTWACIRLRVPMIESAAAVLFSA